jgi:hypothetical protein
MGQCSSIKPNDDFEIYRRKFILLEKVCDSQTKQLTMKDNINDVASIKNKYDLSKKLPENITELQTIFNTINEIYNKQEALLRPHQKGVKQKLINQCSLLMNKYHISSNQMTYN